MKFYQGTRTPQGCVVTVTDGTTSYPLPVRLDLHNYSPTGFEWAYRGSGPSQLALALTADALGNDEEALKFYQAVRDYVVSRLIGDKWILTDAYIKEFTCA